MAKDVFLFTGCSHVVATGMAGGGWVAVCDGRIAYGNVVLDDMARVADAEAASGLAGVRSALHAFPGATRILLTTDGNEIQFVPCGHVAEGLDPALDPTGILAECRSRGVELAVRWWPGHNPGPQAADILLVAARVLAVHARRGNLRSDSLPGGQGWRSRLVLGLGRHPFNNGIKEPGLTWRQAAVLTGLDEGLIPSHLEPGPLKVANPSGVTLSSALEFRDDMEAAGTVVWPPDDFGGSYLQGWSRAPVARLFVAYHAHGKVHGVAISRNGSAGADVWSRRVKFSTTANAHKAAVVSTILSLAQRLGHEQSGGTVEVVTTDPWLAILMDSGRVRDEALASALATLAERAADAGLTLRPRLVREDVVRNSSRTEAMVCMLVALSAARIASASEAYNRRAATLMDAPDALLPRVLADADALGDGLTQDAQARVTAELFGLVLTEQGMRRRFEALAHVTHATGVTQPFVRRPLLPGRFRGGVARVGDAVHPASTPLVDDGLLGEWESWWRDYAVLCEQNPVLALREAVLRIDAEPDLARWPKLRHRAVANWIAGIDETCPFNLPQSLRDEARSELRGLLEACGRWPFTWVRTPLAQAA